MRTICDNIHCTACGACVAKCPKHCISFEEDSLSAQHPVVNESACVNCNLCEKVCPVNHPVEYRGIERLYAAWNKNEEQRKVSASGGVAAAFYKTVLSEGGFAYGVAFDVERGAYFVELAEGAQIQSVQNSKYVYSSATGIYRQVEERLKQDQTALFIGLPCQVAALLNYLGKPYERLVTVDIICHGTAPFEYLKQHVEAIERRKKSKTDHLFFRDPKWGTYIYW